MNEIAEKVFDQIIQTEAYIKAQQTIVDPIRKEVYKALIKPLYESDFRKADDLDALFNQVLDRSEYLGFIMCIRFITEIRKEAIEL